MHVHLEPVGGVAGDMFAAAILDYWPELESALQAAFDASQLSTIAQVQRCAHNDHTLTGSKFIVDAVEEHHPHRAFKQIQDLINESCLSAAVKHNALQIFALLADAEGRVHGKAAADVTFHEVGAWDSIADIVSAAWLIDAIGPATWSASALPMGRGRVQTAHGELAVPTPATALLLEGYPLYQDAHEGERITPTGAAILRFLDPDFEPQRTHRRLLGNGTGFGHKQFPGMSNILRILVFEPLAEQAALPMISDQIAVCEFELDDQTAEDVAHALEYIRVLPAVLDVVQAAVYGKKNRMQHSIRLLAKPEALAEVLECCFQQTRTLGVRWQISQRAVLAREQISQQDKDLSVRVKYAKRPDGSTTMKAEMDDIGRIKGGYAEREKLRRRVESDRHD